MAKASPMFGSVLLVIFLCPVERSSEFHLCDDRASISGLLELGDRLPSDGLLGEVGEKDRRAIVVPNIESLTIYRGGIVNLEEQIEQLGIRNDGRIKLQLDDFCVTGRMRTDLFVGWVSRPTARITDLG